MKILLSWVPYPKTTAEGLPGLQTSPGTCPLIIDSNATGMKDEIILPLSGLPTWQAHNLFNSALRSAKMSYT